MGRKIIDTYPRFTISVGPKPTQRTMTWAQANEAKAEFAELIDGLKSATFRDFVVECELVEETRCEHCNGSWTEAGADFNGGCCGKDEANDPERLTLLRDACAQVVSGDYYRFDDETGRRDRITTDWPWALAAAAQKWIDGGRPSDGVAQLMPLIKRVKTAEYCTVWEDPGDYPSNAGAGPLPDQVTRATAPEHLADDLLSLIDDMGLLPAREAA